VKTIGHVMQSGVDDGVFPGAVLLAAKKGELFFSEAFGVASLSPKRPMTSDTVFDLASLTKPLATTVCLMVMVQQGVLSLDHALGETLKAFANTDKKCVTLRQLLSHTSGLPDYRPYFEKIKDLSCSEAQEALKRMLVAEPLIHSPGEVDLYSDLGFMILQWVIEDGAKTSLDSFVTQAVYRPMELENLFYLPLKGNEIRQGHSYAATEDCPWRHKILEGEVHDDNAYVVGGVAGHAGLFGSARDIFGLLQHLLETYTGKVASKVFQRETVQTFFECQQDQGRFALGFDTPTPPESSSGRYFSDHSVGHLGFTGTSFWMDLEQEVIVILLTNRVYPSRDNEKIKEFRPMLHDRVMEVLLSAP
jgi:CubicO group peptidase (beta-lactamase class C family)